MNKKYFYFFVILFFVAIVLLLYWFGGSRKQKIATSGSPTPSIVDTGLKTFKSSDVMDFTIEYPNKFIVNESAGSVTLKSSSDIITVDQSGTNFENLDEYLEDLSIKNQFVLEDKEELMINDMNAVLSKIGEEKIYFIFSKDRVYSLSTNNPRNYSDLDQIARSFQYTPN